MRFIGGFTLQCFAVRAQGGFTHSIPAIFGLWRRHGQRFVPHSPSEDPFYLRGAFWSSPRQLSSDGTVPISRPLLTSLISYSHGLWSGVPGRYDGTLAGEMRSQVKQLARTRT